MAESDFLSRHRIVRNAIRKDVLCFGLPAIIVFSAGLVVSARDGYDGLIETMWSLATQSRNLDELSTPSILGLLLCIAGFSIAFTAVGTLRRFYSSTLVIRENHQLITHGIYRLTRHPIYFGVIIVCFSVPLYASSLYGFLVMSALIPVFLYRISLEERLLTEEFGGAYLAYREATKKLIPFVY